MPLSASPRAVVTGAASGLGRAFCVELARRGARVLAADLDVPGAEETARLVAGAGGQVFPVRCDVTRPSEVAALLALADEKLGGVDLLVNNAGVAAGGPVEAIPISDWEWTLAVDLWGVIYGCHAFLPRFKAQGHGHILNIASAAGLVSTPEMGPYNVAKAGVVALSETLCGELAGTGVGVTVLCPTFFRTNIFKSARTHGVQGEEMVDKLMDRAKLQAAEVARVALDGCANGELYVLPHEDGRVGWRMKRLSPAGFYQRFLPGVRAAAARVGRAPDTSMLAKLRALLVG